MAPLTHLSAPIARTLYSKCDKPDHTAGSRSSSVDYLVSGIPDTVCNQHTATGTGTHFSPFLTTFLYSLDGLRRKEIY